MKLGGAFFLILLAASMTCGSASFAGLVTFAEAGNKTVNVEIADTPEKRTLGLMFRNTLSENEGMWFVFPREEELVFWMKNVRFPIDIIFIDGGMFIRTIWKSVPPCVSEPCPRYPSGVPARYALEVISGFCEKYGIRENQKVTASK